MDLTNTKKGRVEYFEKEVLHLLEDIFDVRLVSTNHYRIESRVNGKRVDYFPKTEKAFLLKEQKWGTILILDLEDSLKRYLKQ